MSMARQKPDFTTVLVDSLHVVTVGFRQGCTVAIPREKQIFHAAESVLAEAAQPWMWGKTLAPGPSRTGDASLWRDGSAVEELKATVGGGHLPQDD
jgi:hypothetical protein